MRGRLKCPAILGIGVVFVAAAQSLAAVATGPSNRFTLDDGSSLFATGGAIPHSISGARDTTSAEIDSLIYTFCVQRYEYLPPGQQAYIKSYDTVTSGGYPNYYLTGYAAWLYKKALGAIGAGPYDSGSEITYGVGGDPLSAFGDFEFRTIQIGIWAGMVSRVLSSDIVAGPAGTAGVAVYTLVGSRQSQYRVDWGSGLSGSGDAVSDALENLNLSYWDFLDEVDAADRNDVGGVRVARMRGRYYDIQDQLLIPDEEPVVPEPASVAIWSLLGAAGYATSRLAGRSRVRAGRSARRPESAANTEITGN